MRSYLSRVKMGERIFPDEITEGVKGPMMGKKLTCTEMSITVLFIIVYPWGFPVAQLVKIPPSVRETWVQSLGWENPLEKGKATHSSILAWRIPWTVYIVHGVAHPASHCKEEKKAKPIIVYPADSLGSILHKHIFCSWVQVT